ncbi:MAG: hypothetical protein JNL67_23220 [Planctomycetaceae bacterium]|nr:hypothetical protein [Planctomycetaceae bacterium]
MGLRAVLRGATNPNEYGVGGVSRAHASGWDFRQSFAGMVQDTMLIGSAANQHDASSNFATIAG